MTNIYLKIDGITGESNVFGHEGEIDVVSWDWLLSRNVRDQSPQNKTSVDHLTFVHEVGLASSGLLNYLIQNRVAAKALLRAYKPTAQPQAVGAVGTLLPPQPFLSLTLENVMVMSIKPYDCAGGHYEEVGLSFSEFKHEYAKGVAGLPGPKATVEHDLRR
ncbi:type VI secretion system tube protein Hcp [Caballeronia sp. LZ029]|uniref:Hcp family type VI secretion system effector n=1 Tax=Caballeronia sp. LZ029 TaxID=3038564 RepID=UPI0028610D71|nr:type VI secretion system tube protein Hcp [Caballeronia sp. LZ029]MDR5745114.1 type VI secretion system tube protein Hcp [Caballeronia sp. LZ029]